ncbi:hypothetical protein MJT46_018789 [Ovis ammon polii x Ovis aries]|nr:hypothetical protein MJT46_018789 [Ovis ammon polii x Ovis aries]
MGRKRWASVPSPLQVGWRVLSTFDSLLAAGCPGSEPDQARRVSTHGGARRARRTGAPAAGGPIWASSKQQGGAAIPWKVRNSQNGVLKCYGSSERSVQVECKIDACYSYCLFVKLKSTKKPGEYAVVAKDVHSAPCPLQAADVTGHQKREGDANQQVHARTRYLAPSNVHGIFRKTLLTAES